MAHGRSGIFVGCYVGVWVGQEGAITERCVKASHANSSTTLPRDASQAHTHMQVQFTAL